MTLKFDGWPSKTIGHLFYVTSSLAHHFIAIGEFKLELESGNAQSGSNSTLFRAVWPWNLTNVLGKQQGICPKHHQAICIISSPYVNSNWSYSPETVKLGVDLCDLDLWPLTLNFCMDIILVIGNNSWKFHDDTMMRTLSKRCHRRTDRQTDRQTEIAILKAAWSQLKTIGHLFYITLSFVHHFKAMGEFKLGLQSRNAQFGSKLAIFVPCDLEIWLMTLKINRAPLLCCFKLCTAFHSHW